MSGPLFAVILAGGAGSRFWPLSTPQRPKQLLPLVGDLTMLEETVRRIEPLVGRGQVLVLTSAALTAPIRALLPSLAPDQVLAEPRAVGTAAALAWASVEVGRRGGPEATLISVHADSAIADEAMFRATLATAAGAARRERALATVGIVPTAPNPGLGYIEPGVPAGEGTRRVARFVEKPERARAEALIAAGGLWNSGIFAWRADDFLDEVRRHTPELAGAMATLGPGSTAEAFFAAVTTAVSVDVGVLERSARVVVVAGSFGWDDVGTWGALRRLRSRDAAGNAVHGRAHVVDSTDNVVHAESGQVVLYGVEDLVVVARDGVTLVTTVESRRRPQGDARRAATARGGVGVSDFVLYDDAAARGFEPFALTRPACALRAGAALIVERWARALGGRATSRIGAPHLASFAEPGAPPAAVDELAAGTWVVNARFAPSLAAVKLTRGVGSLTCDGQVAAVRLAKSTPLAVLADGSAALDRLGAGTAAPVAGWWLTGVWDLIRLLPEMLADDVGRLTPRSARRGALRVIGRGKAHVEAGATVEPYVVADTRNGPVLVRRGAVVQAFTRLVGPCVIGERATVVGGRIAASSVGPDAKVCGELSVSIVIGHANKAHDGFVGHSVIGRWANLGAGTITSNLKNSYGEVWGWTPSGARRTGMQFLGAMIGDHAKLGIGTRLTTGAVVGAAANVFGSRMPPKVVPPFGWGDGDPWGVFDIERFAEVAARVMARRGVEFTTRDAALWQAIFAARWTP